MKCARCGQELNNLNHYYIPRKDNREGMRLCIKCAREEKIVTLI